MTRTAYFISDGTGITAESVGQSLLAQFRGQQFERITLPYVDTTEKAQAVVARINRASELDGQRALVFDTIINVEVRAIIATANAFMVDIFGAFLEPLEQELSIKSNYTVGSSHAIASFDSYDRRIEAVNFALENDDGARTRYYADADVILVGVSRSGKTPTCIFLALQYGVRAANYPITEEDLDDQRLPESVRPYRGKIIGLTIDPMRLSLVRNERRPNSRYASQRQCDLEVSEVELMYKRERIPYLNSTDYSIEEIATRIMLLSGIERRIT